MVDGTASCLEGLFNYLDVALEAEDFVEFFLEMCGGIYVHSHELNY